MSEYQEETGLAPRSGAIIREDFSGRELANQTETSSAALAAQAKAAVEARYVIALRRPRNWSSVRVKLLQECERPGFAAVARYHKPVGDGIEGPSIRFAEAALRHMGNVLCETATIYDDAEKRIVRVTVTDLETNLTYPKDIVVQKTVERSHLRKGQVAIRERTNSSGRKTFIVEATDDDLLNKEAALVSKALRTNGLRILPGDILEECMTRVIQTLNNDAAKDPLGERKRMEEAFAKLGVFPDALVEYLGHPLETMTPAEIVHLRAVYASLRDGEARWEDVLEAKLQKAGTPKPPAATEAPTSRAEAMKAKVATPAPTDDAPPPPESGERRAPTDAPAEKRATAKEPSKTPPTDPPTFACRTTFADIERARAASKDDAKKALTAALKKVKDFRKEGSFATGEDEWLLAWIDFVTGEKA